MVFQGLGCRVTSGRCRASRSYDRTTSSHSLVLPRKHSTEYSFGVRVSGSWFKV